MSFHQTKKILFKVSPLAIAIALSAQPVVADSLIDALSSGTTTGDIRMRYEMVEQDNALDDADALTVRTRLTYKTGSLGGFSGVLEMEDSRSVFGIEDFSVPPTGFKTGQYSVVADPQTTELDQAFIQYKNDIATFKAGRQVITLDGHRFVGHVGWRQDRQTFDALSAAFSPIDDLSITYSHIAQRNRIFAETADIDSKDNLLNVSYKTPVGKVAGYGYFLEVDNDTDNALDTIGISFNGAAGSEDVKFLYSLEFATQDNEAGDYEADYSLIELGVKLKPVTFKLGMETLGSDDGNYGFSTPLATLHKFNGWADSFLGTPAQGLVDTYFSAAGKVGPVALMLAYHDFSADEDTATVDDLGDEIDLQAVWNISKSYTAGIKYAAYSAGDIKVDTDKLWVWFNVKF
ncbi:MAG: alginate export family protein [Cellvibrionaceae bacterium]